MSIKPAEHGDWKSATTRIALVGDSTLDNVCWVGNQEPSISEQLASALSLPPGCASSACAAAVCNLAADGFTSSDVLRGSPTVVSKGRRERIGDAVPVDEDGSFRPLARLQRLDPPPTHVVLSIGGNDVREILGNMRRLPEILQTFAENYPKIVEVCLRVAPRTTVLMLQYRPSWNMDFDGYGVYGAIDRGIPGAADPVAKLNSLMERIYEPILALANRHGLAVVDLPRSFDIYNDELYSHQIEPSAKGGQVIVELLSHAVVAHRASKGSIVGVDEEGRASAWGVAAAPYLNEDDAAAASGSPPPSSSRLYTYAPCVPGAGRVLEEPNLATLEDGGPAWRIPHDPAKVPPTFAACGQALPGGGAGGAGGGGAASGGGGGALARGWQCLLGPLGRRSAGCAIM